MPTRLTVDLFRAARSVATSVSVRRVRDGRRVRSAECDIAQDGRLVARATLLQYRRSTAPPGSLWSVPMTIPFPLDWTTECQPRSTAMRQIGVAHRPIIRTTPENASTTAPLT